MPSNYPGGLDTLATNKADATTSATDHPTHHNDLADAVNKIEAELGIDPSSSEATVAARLAAIDTAVTGKQPVDSDLTAVAALTTTSFGRSLLELANAAAGLSAIGAAAASHSHPISDVTNLQTTLDAKQPLDSDLTAIAALSTATFGRSLLTQADAATARATLGVSIPPTPVVIPLLQASITLTNQAAADTEVVGNYRTKVDLTNATDVRLVVREVGTGAAGADLRVQYSTDESAWTNLTPEAAINATATVVTAWTAVPVGAKGDVFLRMMVKDGDGVADPALRLVQVQVR
jgi:acid phosphatase family membrane protein YuiD